MSGSSLDGLDMAYVHFEENAGQWTYEILETFCKPYPVDWKEKLTGINGLIGKGVSPASYVLWPLAGECSK